MFLDSSAIVEILLDAPERGALLSRLEAASGPFTTSATVIFESSLVLSTRLKMEPQRAHRLVEDFLTAFSVDVLSITRDTAAVSVEAFSRYGKGRHPAKLNFGDCFSYAGARQAGLPLLYVGEDFALTDLA
ncbi:type II toxin-antitoxin system VapC family toxin [Rhizobium sp. RU36D]|uniref:type II toxin-antitoxin system VapC family toxin n=1 Tax=Rhizobium sp. RU36D TaxID=1907415 RepID=UPI0009D907E6|nr:type II toxin-antitoxin system VapC family toxin [Rhizobium sp. RU36D]SMD06897.1 ribonuclease VapC [Rhizobium sp. RU36D]